MNLPPTHPDPSSPQALSEALIRFQALFEPEHIDRLQHFGPATIYTPWVTIWLLLHQRLHPNASLAKAVDQLREHADRFSTNKRVRENTLSTNTSAYSAARTRLKPEVTDAVADQVCDSIIAARPPSWNDRRVFILDGTTLSLASCDALRDCFPPGSNQHGPGTWPIAHLVLAHELASGAALRAEIGAMYGPEADSELSLALELLPRIPAKSLLMADRNFGVFAFVHAAVKAGHDVLLRLTEPRFRSLVRSAVNVGEGRWKLTWKPSRYDRVSHPGLPTDAKVEVWLHEFVGFSGQTLWVVSTTKGSTKEWAELYAQRAAVETDIRHLKETLECGSMRCRSEAMVEKELAMAMVSFNLVVQVRALAAERLKLPPRRLSFSGVWSLVATLLGSVKERTAEEWESDFEWLLRGAGQRKLPNRPGRSYPRKVLPRRRKFPEHNPREPETPVK